MSWQPLPDPARDRPRREALAEAALGRRIALYTGVGLLGIVLGLALTRLPTLLIVGGLVGVASTFVILRWPFAGLLFYTVLFVLRPGEKYPVLNALHLERIVGALCLASLFLSQLRLEHRLQLDDSKQTRLFFFFILAVALSVPFAYWRGRAVQGFTEVLRIAGYYIMVAHLIDSRRRLRWFVYTFLLLIAYLCFDSLRGYFSGGAFLSQGIDRAVGTTSMSNNPNELGTTLASAVPLFLLLALSRSEKWRRVVLWTIVPCLLIGIVLTGSRASMLGMLGGSAYLWWHSRRRVLTGILGVLLVIGGFYLMPGQYKTRYSSMTHSELDASSMSRVVTWVAGLHMLADRPLFGVGIRCYGGANWHYSSGRSSLEAHSLYLQVLGELGLVGTFAFFSFLIEMLRLNRRTARRLQGGDAAFEKAVLDGIFTGFLVLLVSGVFGHSLLRRTWYVFAATGLAILRTHLRQRQAAAAAAVPERVELHRAAIQPA